MGEEEGQADRGHLLGRRGTWVGGQETSWKGRKRRSPRIEIGKNQRCWRLNVGRKKKTEERRVEARRALPFGTNGSRAKGSTSAGGEN